MLDLILVVAAVFLGLFVFFLPTYIAGKRKHRCTVAIFVCNLLSLLFFPLWFVGLIWSGTSNVDQ